MEHSQPNGKWFGGGALVIDTDGEYDRGPSLGF